jgi:hypothetical protein
VSERLRRFQSLLDSNPSLLHRRGVGRRREARVALLVARPLIRCIAVNQALDTPPRGGLVKFRDTSAIVQTRSV